jgi:hypothetical protein
LNSTQIAKAVVSQLSRGSQGRGFAMLTVEFVIDSKALCLNNSKEMTLIISLINQAPSLLKPHLRKASLGFLQRTGTKIPLKADGVVYRPAAHEARRLENGRQ